MRPIPRTRCSRSAEWTWFGSRSAFAPAPTTGHTSSSCSTFRSRRGTRSRPGCLRRAAGSRCLGAGPLCRYRGATALLLSPAPVAHQLGCESGCPGIRAPRDHRDQDDGGDLEGIARRRDPRLPRPDGGGRATGADADLAGCRDSAGTTWSRDGLRRRPGRTVTQRGGAPPGGELLDSQTACHSTGRVRGRRRLR